jgi:hypothetical protein
VFFVIKDCAAGIKTMIVHEDFDYDTATNDICLLELQGSSPAVQ